MGYRICNDCGAKYSDRKKQCDCKIKSNNEYSKQYYEDNKELKKMLNSKRWKTIRNMTIKRDGGMCNRCWVQLGIVNTRNLQVHHIKPRKEYPELMFEPDNLITTCKTCNLQMGTSGIDWDIEKISSVDSFDYKF